MKTRIAFTLLISIAFYLSSCNNDCITGSGNSVSRERLLTHFDKLDISGAYKVELTQGSVQKVEVIADENLHEHILTEVNGNRLKVSNKPNFCSNYKALIKIQLKELEEIETSGAVDINTLNEFKINRLLFKSSGATNSELMIDAQEIDTRLSGAGKIKLKGQVSESSIDISGAAKVMAFDLVTNKCEIEVSGAADSEVNVLSELNVSASGASKVRYKGNPSKISKNTSGASSVTQAN